MNEIFIYISLAAIVLLFIFSSIFYKSFKVWKLLLIILTGGVYAVIIYYPQYITFINIESALEYYTYYLFFMVVVYGITFKNKIRITRNLTDYDFFELEKELEEVNYGSDLLRLRFISTIDLLNDGLIFYNPDLQGMFLTEKSKNIVSTKGFDIEIGEYVSRIHKEDQTEYLSSLKKISKKNPSFEIKYRVLKGNSFTWVVEKCSLFTYEGKDHLVSTLKGIDIKMFPETLIDELDSLPDEGQLTKYLAKAKKENETYYLVMLHLTNIPDINRRFGRDVGNLMIAEYIKKMRYHFARENNTIFRVTGIQFALIIRDEQKYGVMKRALVSGGDLINLHLNIGGIKQVVYPNVGIVKNDPWTEYEVNDFITLSQKTLDEAIRNDKKNFSIFGE